MMYAATLTPSLEEKAAIYEAATKKGSFWNAHNNLGAVYIAQAIENSSNAAGLADKALAQLEIAAKIKDAPEVNANLASVNMLKGNAYAAYKYANKALGSGLRGDNAAGTNGVKGSAAIVMAKYSEAVSAESAASNTANNLYNKGLAQVLNKDYQNALTSFGEATKLNSNHALAFYGAAIASARLSKAEDVVSNITSAVKIDPSLKEAALTDLEFAKYVTTEAFRAALN
jgi:tetratricopeptide (TPR) repeat protein